MNQATLIVANWKMHLRVTESLALVERLGKHITPKVGTEVVLCPSAHSLALIKLYLEAHEIELALGAQTVNEHDEGAYTGEVSAAQLRDVVEYAICGHSERRMYYGETSKQVAAKVAASMRQHIKPILCVGENLTERESGHGKRRVLAQLRTGLSLVTHTEAHNLIVAYEPVWAISTTKHAQDADPDDIAPVLRAIRQELEELYGEEVGAQIPLLYGGSVTDHNAGAYLGLEDCNGLLVGGASLNWAQFSKIVQTAQSRNGGKDNDQPRHALRSVV